MKTPFVQRVSGRMSLQVEQLNAEIETKTKDNVFVRVKLAVQYKVGASEQQVQDAFYKLDDPQVQIQSYAFDVVRSHIPSMDLDEAYADADTIVMPIRPASVPSATVLAVIFSSVSWSIRTHPCFRSSGPPNRFPCERARHREAPRRAARTPARTLRRERSNKFHRKILCLRG